MHRLTLSAALVTLLLSALGTGIALGSAHTITTQTSDSGLSTGFPEGISFETLASGAANALPATPVNLRLERVTLESGDNTGLAAASGPELLYVESGALLIADELGIEGAYPTGEQLLVPMGANYGVRNDGGDDATLLRLGLAPNEDTSRDTSGEDDGTDVLLGAELAMLPPAPVRVFLARVTWEPGTVFDLHTFTGPVGMLAESGTLTISGPSGLEGQLAVGNGIVFPAGVVNSQRNASEDPVVILMAGVVPIDENLSATVTPTPAPIPTAEPTATQIPADAIVPTDASTATAEVEASGVLYEATQDEGFDEWSASGEWKYFEGRLVNDGTGTGVIYAPWEPTTSDDYAVEAEIRVIRGVDYEDYFGVVARSAKDTEVHSYVRWYDRDGWRTRIDLAGETLVRGGFDPGTDWHTYRIEVDGNRVRFLIDGTLVHEVEDNRLISDVSGQVGIRVRGIQIDVRSFRVVSLREGSATFPVGDIERDEPQSLRLTEMWAESEPIQAGSISVMLTGIERRYKLASSRTPSLCCQPRG